MQNVDTNTNTNTKTKTQILEENGSKTWKLGFGFASICEGTYPDPVPFVATPPWVGLLKLRLPGLWKTMISRREEKYSCCHRPVETAIAWTVETTGFAVESFPSHCQAHGLQLWHTLHLGFKVDIGDFETC